ncbi:peptide chain release factor 2 [Reyranella sp.]|uniref:peptide chain release factor 2 n=1 Tax=Reyranella sp. TaxID=1929291 RepID=UPI00378376CF
MRAEATAMANEIEESLALLRRRLDYDRAVVRLDELNARAEDPALWDDPKQAQSVMRERTRLDGALATIRRLRDAVDTNVGLIELAEAEGDEIMIGEAEKALAEARVEAAKARLETLLSGEADPNNAYVELNAGAGGTEAQDWAEMLARMYTRWAERRGYKVSWLEESAGEEAGIKSCAFKVEGPNAYGWLKTESGVHRLVRISPFDGNARRQTSFASVWVYPEVDDDIEIEVLDKDLRVDTYRASGAGGQHVNKTDSAVRITHIPTGIAVAVQQERSQHQNRAKAMQMLKARLYEVELQKREAERLAAEANKTDIGWGHQIRSYVLQPYQMVKDLRTSVERSDPQKVLDGDLDDFMAASLAARVGEGNEKEAA